MSATYTFEFDGSRFIKILQKAKKYVDEEFIDELQEELGPIIVEAIKDQITSQGNRPGGGGEFAPLSDAYSIMKRKKYGDKLILVRTDEMLESLLSGEGFEIEIDRSNYSLLIKAGNEYGVIASYHQRGAGRLPVRLVLTLTEKEYIKIIDVTTRLLNERFDKLFG